MVIKMSIFGKISKERTVSAVILAAAALASILPGGIILVCGVNYRIFGADEGVRCESA